MGGAIISRLIHGDDWPSVLLLVRASNGADGRARILAVLKSFMVPEALLSRVETRQIICGSLDGVSKFAGDERLRNVTRVINCAALASFANHPQVWQVNVEGTLEFARVLHERAQLRRFLHVGTAMSCGVQAASPVREDYEPGTSAKHLVEYTDSKLTCEYKLRQELPGLPLVVARPSIIVGDTRLGCRVSPSIFWVFGMAATLRRFTCELEQQIDVVPVDYCADAILVLLQKPDLSFDRYHISAGHESSSTYGEICSALAPFIGGRSAEPYQKVSHEALCELQSSFDTLFGAGNKRLLLRAMRLYGQFAALGIIFDNRRTLAEGIPSPMSFANYAARCADTTKDLSIYEQMKYDFKGAAVVVNRPKPVKEIAAPAVQEAA